MENPASWGPAEKTINRAYSRFNELHREGHIGVSVVRFIADALRERGLLLDRPIRLIEHDNEHDGEFHSGCKYCDWERVHNDNYPSYEWEKYENA